MSDEQIDETFSWDVPETFNFSTDVIDKWASNPELLALITADETGSEQRFTYAEIASDTARLSNLLAELGVQQGDRIVIMLPELPNGR